MSRRMLLVGESWMVVSTHQKGFDTFTTVEYTLAADEFKRAMSDSGWTVTHLPAHEIASDFPTTAEELATYDAVVISDVGSNTFLLTPTVFSRSEREPDRLRLIADYVRAGGGLVMVGGYLSFSGIDAKARYGRTALAEVLAVAVADHDDRVELPEGVAASVAAGEPLGLAELGDWPPLLGYNQTVALGDATIVATVGGDPLICLRKVGSGRSAVFTSDLAPHWASPEFVGWAGYRELWARLFDWVAKA